VFCPNCGTQNPDAAQTCSKCNFHLKSVAAPKFKGTMLMMNQAVPGNPAPGAAAPPPRPGGPGPSAPPPGAVGPAVPSKLKGTMVGVAPMAGPARGVPGAPVPPATPLPPGPAAYGAPPEMASAYSPPVAQGGVNPLGGTVAADGSAFAAAFPAPGAGGVPYGAGAPLPQGTALMPGAPGYSPYGTPSPAPVPHGGYGAPQPGYGTPPAPAPQPGSGAPPAYDAGPPIGGSPYGTPPPNPFGGPPPA
jgi:hypothetical protein